MKLSRTDLVPVLAIIGGGALGLLASGFLVFSSRVDYVPAPVPVVVPFPSAFEAAARPIISPDGEWVAFQQGGRIFMVPVTGGAPLPVGESGTLPR